MLKRLSLNFQQSKFARQGGYVILGIYVLLVAYLVIHLFSANLGLNQDKNITLAHELINYYVCFLLLYIIFSVLKLINSSQHTLGYIILDYLTIMFVATIVVIAIGASSSFLEIWMNNLIFVNLVYTFSLFTLTLLLARNLQSFANFFQQHFKTAKSKFNLSHNPQLRAICATHEAGHALIYSFLGLENIPANITVKLSLGEEAENDAVNGMVQCFLDKNLLETAEYLHAFMLISIAGKIAEKIIHNTDSLGSKNDFILWERYAYRYLTNGYFTEQEYFYKEATNEAEVKHNAEVLRQLYQQQQYIVHDFLFRHQDTLKELAAEISAKGKLYYTDLIPYLQRLNYH